MLEESGQSPGVTSFARGVLLKGRYQLERVLGRGGMASVWRANDTVLDRAVAVKVLADTIASDPEFQTRFRREARVLASLRHPNLLSVYDYAEGDERPYLVMEYVPGGTLAQRIASGAPIDCRGLAHELLGAVAHIHGAGIVHRDIKPQNILLGPDGSAKLIDFGIALPSDATALTQTGNLLGTARYLAPELMNGGTATERSDLYSCGIVLRECLDTGPMGSRLRQPVEWLCAEDPLARPASAEAALAQIEAAASVPEEPTQRFTSVRGGRGWGPRPAPRTLPPLEPGTRRPGWSRAAAALAILAAVAVGIVLIAGGSQGQGGAGPTVAKGDRSGGEGSSAAATESERPESSSGRVPAAAGTDPTLGSTLNEEGYALIQAGQYGQAVPLLDEAVRAFPPGTQDINYAYALFNLGNALRLSGRPEEAVPVLEERLRIPNQVGTVTEELEAARSEAAG
ncbi:MAG: eukaryotic-like serine/threonine-protein kinase [Solirubrobacterales bacterium]|nr:eukaryotic-like serine/threonine-protein kinase [Solirubrobacterales bacterium]